MTMLDDLLTNEGLADLLGDGRELALDRRMS